VRGTRQNGNGAAAIQQRSDNDLLTLQQRYRSVEHMPVYDFDKPEDRAAYLSSLPTRARRKAQLDAWRKQNKPMADEVERIVIDQWHKKHTQEET
jgi:hypothetical protein